MKPNANINEMYDMTVFHSHTWHRDRSCWGPIMWPSQHSDLKHGDENHTTLGSQECAICRTFCVFGFIGYVRCQLLPQKKMQRLCKDDKTRPKPSCTHCTMYLSFAGMVS